MTLPDVYDLVIQETDSLLKETVHVNDLFIVYKPITSTVYGNVCGFELCSNQYNSVSAHFRSKLVAENLSSEEFCPSLIDRQIRFLMEILMSSHISQQHDLGIPLYVSIPWQLLLNHGFMAYLKPFLNNYKQVNSLFLLIEIDDDTPFSRLFSWLKDSEMIRTRQCLLKWRYNPSSASSLHFFQQYSQWSAIPMVASQIQTHEAYEHAKEHQVYWIMGSYVAVPQRDITGLKGYLKDNQTLASRCKPTCLSSKNEVASNIMPSIGDITSNTSVLTIENAGSQAKELFDQNAMLEGIVIISDKETTLGLVMREQFYRNLGRQYGYEIFMSRPIHLIMVTSPLVVEAHTPIDVVGEMAMRRSQERLYDYVVVQKEGRYHGVVSIRDLLINISDMNVNIAKYANPLTGLPGNIVIDQRIEQALHLDACTLLYLDLNYFKSYNDLYGFRKGDEMLRSLANILQKSLLLNNDVEGFLGHIGGDDFVILLNHYHYEALCHQIIQEFDAIVPQFYRSEDQLRGYVISHNRSNKVEQIPLASLSITSITNEQIHFGNLDQLTMAAALGKKICKQTTGSHLHTLTPSQWKEVLRTLNQEEKKPDITEQRHGKMTACL